MTATSDVVFCDARIEQLGDIVQLIADDRIGATREASGGALHPDYIAAFDAIESDPNQRFVIAMIKEDVVGCCQLTFIPGFSRHGAWRGQIESVRVSSGHRGKGIGQAFMLWTIEQCRARGCKLVQLTTDKRRPEARDFYTRLGFIASHEGMKLEL